MIVEYKTHCPSTQKTPCAELKHRWAPDGCWIIVCNCEWESEHYISGNAALSAYRAHLNLSMEFFHDRSESYPL